MFEKTKRAVDVVVAAAGIVALMPLLLLIAVAVAVDMGWPVIFAQTRPGLGGRPFLLVKFRTMRQPALGESPIGSDAQRLTRLGRVLRSTSLDELPELWNVLKGEMSLVGPRPLLMEYMSHYTPRQSTRHDVRPGMTGWAQVNGRNAISWTDKLELDAWYVEHRSALLDTRILLRTFLVVFSRRGISMEGAETASRFDEEAALRPKDRAQGDRSE